MTLPNSPVVRIRCDAGSRAGYGHVFRCMALADALSALGFTVVFHSDVLALFAIGLRYPKVSPPSTPPADVWIVDLEGGCPPSLAERLARDSSLLVIINGTGYPDTDPGRLQADLVIYQGRQTRPYLLDWGGFAGLWIEGLPYVILRSSVFPARLVRDYSLPRPSRDPPRILVTGGGSDPTNFVPRATAALASARPGAYNLCAVIGPAADYGPEAMPPGTDILQAPHDLFPLYATVDAVVCTFGMTAYEAAATGVPTLAFGITPDHDAGAELLARELPDLVLACGPSQAPVQDIASVAVSGLDHVLARRRQPPAELDGLGAARVAALIYWQLEDKINKERSR